MTNHPPAEVLAMRLEHELNTAALYFGHNSAEQAEPYVIKAREILAQLREAMK